ncbi:hypothetical protein D9M73_158640 [compost metagenome]
MPASHIRPLEADGIEVKLPFRVLVAAAPGGDVVQQGKVHQVRRTMQWWTTTQEARRAHRKNLFIKQGCG